MSRKNVGMVFTIFASPKYIGYDFRYSGAGVI
jgi:hypothetical protein